MFFALSKVLDLFIAPLTWAVVLGVLGAIRGRGRYRRHRRAAVLFPGAAVLVLYLFSTGPIENLLFRGLEASAVSTVKEEQTYDAVIILGGLVDSVASESHGTLEYNESVERLLVPYELLRNGRARFALLSGGTTEKNVGDAVESRVLAEQLARWGIDRQRLVIEDGSRNTHENAVNSAAIVKARGWESLLLVTSAFHMQRAAGCFRAEGMTFDVLPVDYRSYDPARFSGNWLPRADRLAESTAALREYVGRVVYRLQGYAKE